MNGDDSSSRPTRDHVVWAYRLLLDREPEDESVVQGFLDACSSTLELRNAVLWSAEFRRKNPTARFEVEDTCGVDIPPEELIRLVSGSASVEWFLRSGRLAADALRETLARHGVVLAQLRSILDLGCGCGRVLRRLSDLPSGVLHGCDYNPLLVEWCREHLRSVELAQNELDPPLPYGRGEFELVYALSVFTHLTEELQRPWMRELRRVLGSRGLLYFTLHGEGYRYEMDEAERSRFERGALVVRKQEAAGTNECGVFHPRRYVERLARKSGFEVLAYEPQGARGNPAQDAYLLRAI